MTRIGLVRDLNTKWWKEFKVSLNKRNANFIFINIERSDWIEQVDGCSHIIWRPNLTSPFLEQAKDKLFIIEKILGKPVYPNESTFWHYDNKKVQDYLLKATKFNVKTPETFITYDYKEALNYLKTTEYPIISKSSHGAASKNVRMIKSFSEGVRELDGFYSQNRILKSINWIIKKLGYSVAPMHNQKDYVYYQSFIKNAQFDTKVMTIGDKIFAIRRFNRSNDFRASGSGKPDYNPELISTESLQIARDISKEFGFQSMGYDFLLNNGNSSIFIEMSYTFVDKLFFDRCPGFWDSSLKFHEKTYTAQEAIVEYLYNDWGLNKQPSFNFSYISYKKSIFF